MPCATRNSYTTIRFTFQYLFVIVTLLQAANLCKYQVTQPVASGCSDCFGLPNLQQTESQVSKALSRRCCQQNFNAYNCSLTTSALRSCMTYSHANLKESALLFSKKHQQSIKIRLNAQHAATTKIQCYCYVWMAGTAVLLQLRCYWANYQPAAAR